VASGKTELAQKVAGAYNSAVKALEDAGANVGKALTGPKGGNGQTVKYLEEILPEGALIQAEPIIEPVPIVEPIIVP